MQSKKNVIAIEISTKRAVLSSLQAHGLPVKFQVVSNCKKHWPCRFTPSLHCSLSHLISLSNQLNAHDKRNNNAADPYIFIVG